MPTGLVGTSRVTHVKHSFIKHGKQPIITNLKNMVNLNQSIIHDQWLLHIVSLLLQPCSGHVSQAINLTNFITAIFWSRLAGPSKKHQSPYKYHES